MKPQGPASERVVYTPIRRSQDARLAAAGGQYRSASAILSASKPHDTQLKYVDDQVTSTSLSDESAASSHAGAPQRREPSGAGRIEEVYLCTCCGSTRELDPAMVYMPVFKSLFALFNLLVLLSGLATLATGLWFRIDPKVYELFSYIETQNFTLATWTLALGGLVGALVALLAGCGAARAQSMGLFTFYALTTGALSICSLSTLLLVSVHGLGDSLERYITKEIYEQLRLRTMNIELEDPVSSSQAAQFLDFVQVKLRCCGALDYRDYQKLGMVTPTTCYTIAANFVSAPGCGQALRELMDWRAGLAAGLAGAALLAQLLASLLAALIICTIYNHRARPRPASAGSMAPMVGVPGEQLDLRRPAGAASRSPRPLSRASSIEV